MREVDTKAIAPNLDRYVNEMLVGRGGLIVRDAFDRSTVREARDRIIELSSREGDRVTHFHGDHEDQIDRQRRVWNLLDKGAVFAGMVQHPVVVEIVEAFLGQGFCLGSIAANRLLPDGPGQEPHIDYPYWDYYDRPSFPVGMNASFPLNCQATVMLDDFTVENGATAWVPGTQRELAWPADSQDFHARAERQCGRAGDVVVFNGLCWHCAMPNRSDRDRVGVLIQYLPKFVKPMEDQHRGVRSEVIDSASPLLRQLLGLEYPYPALLDEAEPGNTEGRYSVEARR